VVGRRAWLGAVVVDKVGADHLLTASRELKQDLEGSAGRLVPKSLGRFSKLANEVLPAPTDDDRTVVMSPWPVPLDLVQDGNGDWGMRGIFSHVLMPERMSLEVLRRSISADFHAGG